ncbi:hypothetical protein QZH41_010182, partial [Actinostola sp. cb2023]
MTTTSASITPQAPSTNTASISIESSQSIDTSYTPAPQSASTSLEMSAIATNTIATPTINATSSTAGATTLGNATTQSPEPSQTATLVSPVSPSSSNSISEEIVAYNSSSVTTSTTNLTSEITSTSTSVKQPVPSSSAITEHPTVAVKTKSVTIEATFGMDYKKEYDNKTSKEYKDLKKDLTKALSDVYKDVDGFRRIDILSIRKGSVVCEYDVVLNDTSKVNSDDLRKTLLKASEAGQLGGYTVTKVTVKEKGVDEKTKEVLPLWALVALILLGVVALILLITVIVLAVVFRRAKETGPLYNVTGEDWANTYETLSMGDY